MRASRLRLRHYHGRGPLGVSGAGSGQLGEGVPQRDGTYFARLKEGGWAVCCGAGGRVGLGGALVGVDGGEGTSPNSTVGCESVSCR